MTNEKPKVFISYCWSTSGHCERIRLYAERLVNDGVDVILDQWELSGGQDKYAFMEKMVTDKTVTHVLIFSDQEYAKKADNREAGVGTESQIISKEVYDKVDQQKFIPLVCERQTDNEPHLPIFLKSRIWIDFSSPEAANDNWERLIRVLYGKPMHQKPVLGTTPSYLTFDETKPILPTIGKFIALRDAMVNSKPTVSLCRNDFLDAALSFADGLRIRKDPQVEFIDEKILEDLRTMLPLRDQLIDWLLLETALRPDSETEKILIDFLERLLVLKHRPPEVMQFSESWFDAHRIFVYEMFLYLLAVLVKQEKFGIIHGIVTTHYLLPESESHPGRNFVSFDRFYAHSDALEFRKKRLNLKRISLIADVIKERATRKDIPFSDIMQAELVVMLIILLSDDQLWYPHTLVYSGRGGTRFPLFVRATQHKHFPRLVDITGISTGDELREKFKLGCERHKVNNWTDLTFWADVSFWDSMNMDALDTIT